MDRLVIFAARDNNAQVLVELCNMTNVNIGLSKCLPLWQHNGRPYPTGATALHIAALHGSLECVRVLLAIVGVDINAVDQKGCTALFRAIRHLEILRLLLKKSELNLYHTNKKGFTVFHKAADCHESLRLLFTHARMDAVT